MNDLSRRVLIDNEAAAATESHTPRYTEDEVASIERVHVGADADDTESDDDILRVVNIGRQNNRRGVESSSISGEDGDGDTWTSGGDTLTSAGGRGGIPLLDRRIPFPKVTTDEGRKNGGEIMRCAKSVGFGVSLKHGIRKGWFEERGAVWFGLTGMFRKYKPINASRLSIFINSLCKEAQTCFPQQNHSNDQTGRLGEDIPWWASLVRDYDDWRKSAPSANTQQQANRIVNAVVQQTLMEPRNPLGQTGAPLRSQVRDENRRNRSDRPTAASVIRNNASLVGLVEDAGVQSNASGIVARGVGAAISGMNSRRSRNDVISHIERSRERQAVNLCNSLGGILNSIVHPPRTLSDIAKDYREAERSLSDATTDGSESFWRSICLKLAAELESFGGPTGSGRSAD